MVLLFVDSTLTTNCLIGAPTFQSLLIMKHRIVYFDEGI